MLLYKQDGKKIRFVDFFYITAIATRKFVQLLSYLNIRGYKKQSVLPTSRIEHATAQETDNYCDNYIGY